MSSISCPYAEKYPMSGVHFTTHTGDVHTVNHGFVDAGNFYKLFDRPFVRFKSAPPPSTATASIIRWMAVPPRAKVLEICCGPGYPGLSTFGLGAERVTLVDINPECLESAQLSARLSGVEDRCRFILSDVFQKVPRELFDAIILNPPYWDAPRATPEDAWRFDPGFSLQQRFLDGCLDYLAPGGIVNFTSVMTIIEHARKWIADRPALKVLREDVDQWIPGREETWIWCLKLGRA
jgi:SAM-dependent methyltransferase